MKPSFADLVARRRSAYFLMTVGNVASPASALIVSAALAHELGVVGRGETAAILAPYLLLVSAASFGLPEAATYFVARQSNWRNLSRFGFGAVAILGAASTAITVLCAGYLAGGDPEIAYGIAVCVLALVPMLALGFQRGRAAGLQQWRRISVEKIAGSALRVSLTALLIAANSLTATNAALVLAFAPCVGIAFYVRLRGATASVRRDSTLGLISFRELVGYSGRVWIGSIAGILLMRVDQMLMVPLANAYELGLYVVAVNVGEVLLVISNSVREIVLARESSTFSFNRLRKTSRRTFGLVCLISAVLVVSSPLWFVVVFGPEFDDARLMAVVMIAAVCVGVPGSVAGSGLAALGRPGLRSASLCIACIVNVAMVVLFVPGFGAWGAVLATLAGNLMSSNLNIICLRRLGGPALLSYYFPSVKHSWRLLVTFVHARFGADDRSPRPGSLDG